MGCCRRNSAVLLAAVLALSCASATYSQILYGSIVGHVEDPSGASITRANVTITNKQTGLTREIQTDSVGRYEFANVPAGSYEVRITAAGFQTVVQADVPVTINNVTRVDQTLQVGQVAEAVTVSALTGALQTDRAEVRSEVTTRELVNLPVAAGRNYQQLFRVLPGFTPPTNAHSVPTNPSRALAFNVNGATRSSNNTRIDGASAMSIQLPHIAAYVPSLESIETVNVVSNSFDAEQGLAGGAAINVSTRGGTNEFHGSAFEYHTNNHLKARPFFLPANQGKPKLVSNQWGGSFGGPIRRNSLFFFGAYEETYDRRNAQRFGTVPSEAMKNGDMSASPIPIYDPATGDSDGQNRTPFPNNQIPADRISSISRTLSDLTPLPNVGTGFAANNYFASAPFQFDRRTIDSKINWNASSKLTALVRLGILRYTHRNPQMFGELAGPPVFDGSNPGEGTGGTYSTTVGGTYVFSPSFVVDAYFGYTRSDTSSEQPRLDEKLGSEFLGIPGTNGPRRIEGGWPRFQFGSGLTTIGINEDFMPYYRRDPQYQYVANFNWTRGSHSLRFGMDLYNQHLNQAQAEIAGVALHSASGGFRFEGGPTGLRGGPAVNAYNAYSAFLLGLPVNLGRIDHVPDEYATRMWLHSFYIRDRWNATHRLTLSYGMRYEYFPMPTRPDRGIERYDPETNKQLICGVGEVPRDCGVEVSKLRFAPRFGLAYRFTDDFILRAGYGITNDPFIAAEQLRANYPVLLALGITSPSAFVPVGRLEDGIPEIVRPDLGNGIIDIPGGFAVSSLPQKYERGYIQSWNFTIQKKLAFNFVGQASYVGTREIRKLGYLDINAGQEIGRGNAGRPLNQRFGRIGATTFIMPVGNGQYNALQTSLERRFSAGLQLSANYTWSKAIGYADNSDSRPLVQALAYYDRNRTVRGFDRTHVAHISGIWELPFGKGRRWLTEGPLSYIAGGWQINSLLSLMSGTPFNVQAPETTLDMPGSTQTADLVKSEVAKPGGIGRGQLWFDTSAFQAPPLGRFGNTGYNILRGPGLVNWDFGVFREFVFTERWRLQFRGESFNFSNTPHFNNPGNTIGDASFGQITGVTNLARENIDERQFRFGLRLSF
jgi:hypothetical protein